MNFISKHPFHRSQKIVSVEDSKCRCGFFCFETDAYLLVLDSGSVLVASIKADLYIPAITCNIAQHLHFNVVSSFPLPFLPPPPFLGGVGGGGCRVGFWFVLFKT